jgi:adenosylcobinamide-GDP ribazoletransferase
MLKNELKIFFTAVMFYTRIPCPKWVDHSEEYLNKATRYFPLIGWIVGGLSALILYSAFYLFPVSIAVALSILAGILLTGAFHEDGFADVCDGFGGGWTKQKILDIMKDSRVGTYGVAGLIFILSLKFFSIYELAQKDIIFCCKAIFTAHSISRFAAIILRKKMQYVRENDDSKAKPIAKQNSGKDYFIAALFGLLPLLLFKNCMVFIAIVPIIIAVVYLRYYFNKWIGGYTGDCLGAAQQVTELFFYLSLIALWKFI